MIALQIADIRHFMKKLLLSESFDRFLLLEGSITTFCTFHMDGQLQKGDTILVKASHFMHFEKLVEQLTGK